MDLNKPYVVRFIRRDSEPQEEYYYNALPDARYHFDLFKDDDSGLYQSVELITLDPEEKILQAIIIS